MHPDSKEEKDMNTFFQGSGSDWIQIYNHADIFIYSRLEYLRCRPGRGQMKAVLCLRSAWNAGVTLPA
jgi:hypothetical protein